MTITVTDIVAGPFASTGAPQELAFDFKVFTPDEVEVYTIDVAGTETFVDPEDYVTELNEDVDGTRLEGGSISITFPAGAQLYVRAKPEPTQGQIWSDTGSRLKNLNEALDRATLRDAFGAYRLSRVEGKVADAVNGLTDAALAAVNAEGDIQTTRVATEGDTQDTRVTAEGETQVGLVQAAGTATKGAAVAEIEAAGSTAMADLAAFNLTFYAADVADGIANTVDGQAFAIEDDDQIVIYRNDTETAVEMTRLPKAAQYDSLAVTVAETAGDLSAVTSLLGATTVQTGHLATSSVIAAGVDGYGWRIDRPQVITSVVIGTKLNVNPATAALAVLRPDGAGDYDCLYYDEFTGGITNTTTTRALNFHAQQDDVVLFIPISGCEMRRTTTYAGANQAMFAADPPTALDDVVSATTLSGTYPTLQISGTILSEVEDLKVATETQGASLFALDGLLDRTAVTVGTIGTGATINSNVKAYGWECRESGLLTSFDMGVTDPGDGFLIHARPTAGGVIALARDAVSYGDNTNNYQTQLVVQKGDLILFHPASGGVMRRDTGWAGTDVAYEAASPPAAEGAVFNVASIAPSAPCMRLNIEAFRTLNTLTDLSDAPVHRAAAAAGFTADRALTAGAAIIHQEALIPWNSSPDGESIDLQRMAAIHWLDDDHILVAWQQRLAGRIETGGSTAYVGDAKFQRLVSAEFEIDWNTLTVTMEPGTYQVLDEPATEEHVSNHVHLSAKLDGEPHAYFNSNDHITPVETGKYRIYRKRYDRTAKTWGLRELVSSPEGSEVTRALGTTNTVVRLTRGANAGRVLLPYYSGAPVAYAAVLYSDDDHENFAVGGKFGGTFQEPAITETSSDRILMDLRRADSPGYRHFAESADAGIRFVDLGLQTDLASPEVACSMICKGLTGALDGSAAIVHAGPSKTLTRQNFRLRLSWDDGRGFPWQYAFAAFADDVVGQPDDYTGYSTVRQSPSGTLIGVGVERVNNAKWAPLNFGINGRSEIDVIVLNVAEVMANGGAL